MPTLRPYQITDVNKLAKLKCSACLNEQRTGKTPTSLMVMKAQGRKKILIICPGAALYKWKEEFETWLKKPCLVLDGTPTQRAKKLEQWTDGLVITFDTLKLIDRKDKETQKSHKTGELTNILKHNIDAVIVDEFHRARNKKTLTAKALFKLIDHIPYRLALTGTPAYAKNEDIWTMLHFLYPKLFPNYWDFINEYFNINFVWTPNGMARQVAEMIPSKELKLQHFLMQIATQRKQHDKDVMPWLPNKPIPLKIKLPPTATQQKHLDNLMNYFETEHIICKQAVDRLVRYRQVCQDPGLLKLSGTSAKTQWLQQYYKDYPNRPTIIFSAFTSYLNLLTKTCPEPYGLITGNTAPKERKQLETDFQNGKIHFLFINIQAGKESLTLDTAEAMIFMDKCPPAGDISQASERFTATTESRKDIPKTIYEIILKDTFDEHLYESVEQNKTTTDVLNDFMQYTETN